MEGKNILKFFQSQRDCVIQPIPAQNQAGGLSAISRWSRSLRRHHRTQTPKMNSIPEGCQSQPMQRTGKTESWQDRMMPIPMILPIPPEICPRMNTNSHESGSKRLLQRVRCRLSKIIGSRPVCNPCNAGELQGSRGSPSRFARNFRIILQPAEFTYSSGPCRTKGKKCFDCTVGAEVLAVSNCPIGVNFDQHNVNPPDDKSLPRRLLVLQPLQEVRDRVCSDAVNGIIFPRPIAHAWSSVTTWRKVSVATPVHPLTQLLPAILRFPLGPGQQNNPADHDTEANQCQINASLSHGPNIMPRLARDASRNESIQAGGLLAISRRSRSLRRHHRTQTPKINSIPEGCQSQPMQRTGKTESWQDRMMPIPMILQSRPKTAQQ